MVKRLALMFPIAGFLIASLAWAGDETVPDGFVSLFNGKDLTGWKVPAGDNGHWKVVDGVIDYDASSEATGDKSLWGEREYEDYVLKVDWRLKEAPYINKGVPYILPDGTHAKDIHGKEMRMALPDADSGVYLRGDGFYQINIWCWPIGSGEMYSLRTDRKTPPEAARGRDAANAGRQACGRVESFRDHREGENGQRGIERGDRHPQGHDSDPSGPRPDRISASRRQKQRWCLDRTAQPRSVQKYLYQRIAGQLERRPSRTRCGPC